MTARPQDPYQVSAVTRYLRELLQGNRHLTDIWIEGEVSNLSRPSSGHIYFTLKDRNASLRCVFFRNRNMGQGDRVEGDASLIVHGSMSLYEQRGELSFQVDFVQPAGTGALAAEFERRRAAFEAEGVFAEERKRPLPRFPRRIGVVTSPTGAVIRDITTVLARRWPMAELVLAPAPVQGLEAAPAVAEAIRVLGREHQSDVVIVARGGGAAEDLWAFNEELVVRAIYASPVPVVSAVGHETDVTLADLVADLRAATPSAAAELVAPDRADVARVVTSLRARGEVHVTRGLAAAREALDGGVGALIGALPDVAARRQLVVERATSAMRLIEQRVARTRESTAEFAGRLTALSPAATLERGYAIVERDAEDGGGIVTRAADLSTGDRVTLQLRDGRKAARIESNSGTA
ncbi:MAG TPA: exodeoxyribonuclease VII large subunit [Dehalococcoidia bacterium]|jgi:exodeoxyribonuclease VII large subunit|nr:exodeoxyribonuclease VII large subunit [Dehalococcoidia bacterium]